VRRVSTVGSSSIGWFTVTLGITCSSVLGCNVSNPMDWEGRPNTMDTTFTGHYPSGLFYEGKLRTMCIRHQFQTFDALKANIRNALAAVTEEMLEKTWREIEYRLDVLQKNNGVSVELY
jgi:hypothetical protein